MAIRMETASGLRFYACDQRLRMGESASLRFLDPIENTPFNKIELLFETMTLVKHCRLNNRFFHTCARRYKITPKSIFLFTVDAENIVIPNTYILRDSTIYDTLASPWKVF